MPLASNGEGRKTSTPATCFEFSGFNSSETYCGRSSGRIVRHFSPIRTRAVRWFPYRSTVGTAVTGTTPVGSIGSPTSASSSVDLPRLNWPTQATKNRPSLILATSCRTSAAIEPSPNSSAIVASRPSACASDDRAAEPWLGIGTVFYVLHSRLEHAQPKPGIIRLTIAIL